MAEAEFEIYRARAEGAERTGNYAFMGCTGLRSVSCTREVFGRICSDAGPDADKISFTEI